MATHDGNLEFARQLLTEVLVSHENRQRLSGMTNSLAAQSAGEVAMLCGFKELEESYAALLLKCQAAASRPRGAWNWLIGLVFKAPEFVAPDERMWAAMNRIPERETAERALPIITEQYWATHLSRYPENNFKAAFQNATSEYEKECVALTEVAHGRIYSALSRSKGLAEEHRAWNVQFVATIEAYRTGRTMLGAKLLASLPSSLLCEWGKAQLALGITGRAAWGGYPYPDY